MKRKLAAMFLLAAIALGLGGCGSETAGAQNAGSAGDAESLQYYTELIESYSRILNGETDDCGAVAGGWLIDEVRSQDGTDKALSETDFLIEDINGDGVSELIVGSIPDGTGYISRPSVFALYTLNGTEPVALADARPHSEWYLTEDCRLINESSPGDANLMLSIFELRSGAAELSCIESYFSHVLPGGSGETAVFRNTSGKYDADISDRTDMTVEQLRETAEKLSGERLALPFSPFSGI